jgi:hypothetical protein
MASDMASSGAKGFLDLPVELRTSIYESFFEGFEIKIEGGKGKRKYKTTSNINRSILFTCRTIYSEALPIASKNLLVNFNTDAPVKFFTSGSAIQKRGVIMLFDCVTDVMVSRMRTRGFGFINYFPRLSEVHLEVVSRTLHRGYWRIREVFRSKTDALNYCNGKDCEARDQSAKQEAKLEVSSLHPFTTRALALPDSDFRIICRVLVGVMLQWDNTSSLPWQEGFIGELVS